MDIVGKLTEFEEKDLKLYAEVLGQYVDPQISQYSPIGWRKIPKVKKMEAKRISDDRDFLENKLGIGWKWKYCGRWKLEMEGLSANPGNIPCDDLPYWNIVPLNSERKEALDYLASEVLPKVFQGKKFVVRDTMVHCGGDASWDCA